MNWFIGKFFDSSRIDADGRTQGLVLHSATPESQNKAGQKLGGGICLSVPHPLKSGGHVSPVTHRIDAHGRTQGLVLHKAILKLHDKGGQKLGGGI